MQAQRAAALLLALVNVCVASNVAAAQSFQPIRRNDYNIDVFNGPTLGSGRLVGMGGAYAPLSMGIDGVPWNTAAYATRELWETSWFGWELSAGLVFPGAFNGDDLDNNGDSSVGYNSSIFASAGLRFQFGNFGFGLLERVQSYTVSVAGHVADVSLNLANVGAGYGFLDGQLVLGTGIRVATFDIAEAGGAQLVEFAGTGVEAGVLLGLHDRPWRVGLSARSAVNSTSPYGDSTIVNADGQRVAGDFVLPGEVHVPWELELGFAYQIGDRPLNRRFVNPREEASHAVEELEREHRARVARTPPAQRDSRFWTRERARQGAERVMLLRRVHAEELGRAKAARNLSRDYILLTADLLLTGGSPNAVGLEAFLSQHRQIAGAHLSPTVRLGAEMEPWANRLKIRAGAYVEPSRFAEASARMHGTFGFDLRLFDSSLFGLLDEFSVRLTASADIAPRYNDWGVAIGFWH